jgi:hypothetical protein
VIRWANISECGQYRYALGRHWGTMPEPAVAFIGLNPSTADAEQDDPTIRRCIAFAKSWGFGGLLMLNLFAFRATEPADMMAAAEPADMMAAAEPVGPDNDRWLTILCGDRSVTTVAAWGTGGAFRGRDAAVRKMLPDLHCLRLTKDGPPGHPLYLPATLRPVPWRTPAC